ncbi:ABC transporter ATP-binding protein [Tessaracoccus antarcticus]|uniref:ABC transporter ATP-binding protein n=2 Tax=Tessaracoccus antarcticus TaxID=2479848 RepID=A0A3M0FYV3_9ACTN|nr:ABC transporter ATP-binding protein [Tessaracoccus antarcticus]
MITSGLRAADPVMIAENLYRFYHAGDEEVLALQGVSLTVSKGEVVAVAGPSGSGKSTLLACLGGLDDPDGGTVRIDGTRMSRQPEAIRARLRREVVGILYQSSNLLPHLSVIDNLELVRRLAGSTTGIDPTQLLDELGIGHRAHALPAHLSGGEAARAGVAVAVVNEPRVLLADEPTGELDSGSEKRLLALLRQRATEGLAVVVASHSPVVLRWADRVLHLADGRPVHGLTREAS